MKQIHKFLVLTLILVLSVVVVKSDNQTDILRSLQDKTLPDSSSTIIEEPSKINQDQVNTNKDIQEPVQGKDELIVPRYKSSLTEEQRKEYMVWVEFKNSLNSYEGQLAKLTKYFAPENPTYYSTIYKSGWPFYTLAGIFGFSLLVYIIMRFGMKYCMGPKQHITTSYSYFTWILICIIIFI